MAGGAQHRVDAGSERGCLLALEIRSGKVGFALFERLKLIDWGIFNFSQGTQGDAEIQAKVSKFLSLYLPDVVVTRGTRMVAGQHNARNVLKRLVKMTKSESVPIVVLERAKIGKFFARHECYTKHDIARFAANRFPELQWRIPRRRKPWQPESSTAAMFDAIATALAYQSNFE